MRQIRLSKQQFHRKNTHRVRRQAVPDFGIFACTFDLWCRNDQMGVAQMNGQVLDLIFLILGVLVMVVALAFARRFEMKPIKISIEKVGSFEMTFVPFLLLIGVMTAGVGQFFRYRNYEERVSHLADLNTQYEQTRSELERFKSYEMMARLVFHDPIDAQNVKGELLYKRVSDADYHQSDISLGLSDLTNELSANIPRVNPGDKFFLIVKQVDPITKQTHTWKSSSVEVPVARLEMVSQ